MKRFTICFIKKDDEILLLNRMKHPCMGLWNGVGGKLETGESPVEGALREIKEETGIEVNGVRLLGTVEWVDHTVSGIGYVYAANFPRGEVYPTPVLTREGVLDWKKLDWILHAENQGIADTISAYLPYTLGEADPVHYTFYYKSNRLVSQHIQKSGGN